MSKESAKELAIKEAYEALGFEWADIHHLVELGGHAHELNLPEGSYDYISDWEWRPKSLSGIETNNGWNRIDEKGNPKTEQYVDIFHAGEIYFDVHYNNGTYEKVHYFLSERCYEVYKPTHWRDTDERKPIY